MGYYDDEDEEEVLLQSVSNYHFENDYKEPVSFSVLRVQWNDEESTEGTNMDVFLRGTTDDGLQILYKAVKAWKFDLSSVNPDIFVLTKDNLWIMLEKPRKSFEQVIRTVLITVNSLHYLRRNPQASGKSLWDHLSRVFGLYDVKPSQNDLIDHMYLISETVKRDDCLVKSKFLLTFLEEKPMKKRLPNGDYPSTSVSGFIVYDMLEDVEDDDSNDDDYCDNVCAICDNGGELLCCDGSCLRSFHATEEDGEDSLCGSLGLTKREVDDIRQFLCKNCKYRQHQCFICKQIGSSDRSFGAEVFQCVSATCGYFYHTQCVANFLFKGNKPAGEALEKRIASGESFICPLHKCYICKQGEVKTNRNLQFAVCRRCPKSYHRKCLPREIAYEDINEDVKDGVKIRAWGGLLKNRVLLYCLDHEIVDELATPVRDHVKFPVTRVKKNFNEKTNFSELSVVKEETRLKRKNITSSVLHERATTHQATSESSHILKEGAPIHRIEKLSSRVDTLTKEKEIDASRKSLMIQKKSWIMSLDKARTATKNKASLGERLFNYMQDTEHVKLRKEDSAVTENSNKSSEIASKGLHSERLTLDSDSERRILGLIKEVTSSITMEEIIKVHKAPSTHSSSIKHVVEKTITLGKVEGSVQAVRAALKKLDDGSNIEDAMAACEPEVLNQVFKWKNKLKVYLAPFLYGPRYTSFGRHFTKVDKLQEIVDRLHCYAQNDDMIVDFCCGSNDFSWLMKKKLQETGKTCLFKNYDVLQAKNNFSFEMRDWMTVQKHELPPGSKLIMGLNPPFGVKAALANKFINKALEFEPKLLILIVPVETERLDKKKRPYELVWEDKLFLSGKSFYLPGSVDDKHKQMEDWNIVPPPLSLWSHPDWAHRHSEIAHRHRHSSLHHKDSHNAGLVSAFMPMTEPEASCGANSKLYKPVDTLGGDNSVCPEGRVIVRRRSNNSSRKRKINEENNTKGMLRKSSDSEKSSTAPALHGNLVSATDTVLSGLNQPAMPRFMTSHADEVSCQQVEYLGTELPELPLPPQFTSGMPPPHFSSGLPKFTAGLLPPHFESGLSLQHQFTYGLPQPQFAYGLPPSQFTYGLPQPQFASGLPRSQFASWTPWPQLESSLSQPFLPSPPSLFGSDQPPLPLLPPPSPPPPPPGAPQTFFGNVGPGYPNHYRQF